MYHGHDHNLNLKVYNKIEPQRLFQCEDIPKKIFAYEIFKNFIEKRILITVSDLTIFQSMLTENSQP
jgi:hypothetical protein